MDIFKRVTYYFIAIILVGVLAYAIGVEFDENVGARVYRTPTGNAAFVQTMLIQLAVAIGISASIFELVERAHRRRLAEAEKGATLRTMSDVARSAFSSFYDDRIVDKAMAGVFFSPFVRKNFEMRYCLKDYPGLTDVIAIDVHFSFDIYNIGQFTAEYDYIGMLSSQFAPYTNMQNRPKPKFLYLEINGKSVSENKISSMNDKIDVDKATQGFQVTKKNILPSRSITVKGGIQLFKFRSDSEVFRTYFPSESPKITILNETGEDLSFDLAGIGDLKLDPLEPAPENPNRLEAKIGDMLLPYYGWVISWVDLKKFG